ncbi:MAG: hypothetical protein HY695_02715 [Deltaproteobacteria bacterium]|nr:hypothetical protein [Deltaproteobacteria bacterium]
MGKKKTPTKGRKPARVKRRGLQVAILVAVLALAAGAWVYTSNPGRSANDEPKSASAYVRRETKATLSPALFVGKIGTAYQIAQDMPDLLDQLYCYCECDKHSGHRSLLSCYTDNHAANCDVCVNEALDASRMVKQGYGMKEIRREIDRKYSRM